MTYSLLFIFRIRTISPSVQAMSSKSCLRRTQTGGQVGCTASRASSPPTTSRSSLHSLLLVAPIPALQFPFLRRWVPCLVSRRVMALTLATPSHLRCLTRTRTTHTTSLRRPTSVRQRGRHRRMETRSSRWRTLLLPAQCNKPRRRLHPNKSRRRRVSSQDSGERCVIISPLSMIPR